MKREVFFVLYLVFGLLATVGCWWLLLSMLGLAPEFLGAYTLLNLFLAICSMTALLAILVFAGPFIIYDAVKSYLEGSQD